MKHLKKLLTLALAFAMLMSAGALAELPDYLQVGQVPLVSEPVTLKITVMAHDNTINPTETWQYAWITEMLGINVELDYFYSATRNETIALMMAGGELPDIIMGASFSANELTKYGEAEGLLLDLAPYINEENAPSLAKLYAENPQFINELTTPEGAVYSLGGVHMNSEGAECFRMYYNYDWLEALNLEVPTTLDEFLDMLRAFKAYGEEIGVDVVPFGGNYARYNATYLILNALGYNLSMDYSNQKGHETFIMLRDGEVVLPCYDREVFPKYLEVMHTMYEEGLMEQDYYTLDKDTTKAHLAAGQYGVFSEVPAIYTSLEFGSQFFGVLPLTSEYNDTPFWPNYTGQRIGNFVVSAETEYPELCIALADHIVSEEYRRMFAVGGPNVTQTDYLLGKTSGYYYSEEYGDYVTQDYIDNKDQYSAYNYWKFENIMMWMPDTFMVYDVPIGEYTDSDGNAFSVMHEATGDTIMEKAQVRKEATAIAEQYQLALMYAQGEYLTDEFSPTVCYFDEDTTLRIEELQTLIDEYAKQEIAKFVIGDRDLSELDDYFNELEKLGADEYVQYYADYYAAMNG